MLIRLIGASVGRLCYLMGFIASPPLFLFFPSYPSSCPAHHPFEKEGTAFKLRRQFTVRVHQGNRRRDRKRNGEGRGGWCGVKQSYGKYQRMEGKVHRKMGKIEGGWGVDGKTRSRRPRERVNDWASKRMREVEKESGCEGGGEWVSEWTTLSKSR